MDPNFRLLKLVDPSKSVVKIKDCFSKLTLSSNKKVANPPDNQTEEEFPPKPPSVRSHPSRRLFDDFLTDDESESEASELNRIFCSRTTTTKTNGNDIEQEQPAESPRRGSKIFSQRLELSDSDATNCSAEMAPRNDPAVVSEMDRLQVSATQETSHKSSQKLFSEESPKFEDEAAELCQLSSKLSSLQLGGRPAADATRQSSDDSEQRNIDAKLENIFKKQRESYVEIDNEMVPRRISILTISSAHSAESEIEDDNDSEVIIISESESNEDVNNEFLYRVSETKLSGQIRQSTTISGSMADRLNAFFNNIPSLESNQGPERIFQQPETEGDSVVSAEHSVQIEEEVPEDSIEICETPEASEAGDRPVEIPPRPLSPSPTNDASFSSPPRKPQLPELCSPTDRKKTPATSFIQNLASPRRSPRKTPAKNYAGFQSPLSPKIPVRQPHSAQRSPPLHRTTPKQPVASTSGAKMRTATPKKQQTPRTLTPKASQTPERTPTPRTRKKVEPSSPSPPQKASTHSPAISTPPDPSPDLDSSSSPEIRIERINISAKIKIRLQFNDDDFLASVGTSTPTESKASKNTPRLTESEEPATESPRRGTPRRSNSPQMRSQSSSKTGRGSQQMVGTPEHLKQRSIKDPSALTIIDITKSYMAPLALEESFMSEEATADKKRNATKSPLRSLQASLMTEEAPEDNEERNWHLAGKDNGLQSKVLTPEKPLESDLPAIEIHSPGAHAVAPQDSDLRSPNPEVISKQLLTPPWPPIPQKSPEQLELDEKAQRLLNDLYGDAWRTPEVVKVVRTLKEVVRLPSCFENDRNVNESVMDFTKFHKNIQSDLESTRLQPKALTLNSKTENIFKMPATERKVTRKKRNVATKAMTERKPATQGKALAPLQRVKKPHNDDEYFSDSSDIDASSDESWRDVFSGNSDASDDSDESPSNISQRKPPRTHKKTIKNPPNDDLIYLDLSNEIVKIQEVNESPCANKDPKFQDRLEEILATYKAPDKPKIEVTPKYPKIKRKLFTPRFGEEDEAAPAPALATPERLTEFRYKDDDDDDNVTLSAPLPAIFEPINKQLEAVKTGKPIFAIRTPKTTPAKKNKENIPSNNKVDPFTIPSRTQKTVNKTLADTPPDKYSFLQSLDSKFAKKYCHPQAVVYRENYKTQKVELAETLFEIYNDQIFGSDLKVPMVWNKKLLNTAGRCSCSTKLGKRQCRIELSDKVLTSADRLRCTLIHELCHAATWILNGEHGHGPTWKKWARRANQVFPELPKIGVCHDYDIDYKYTYKCTLCNAKSHAHSKSKKVENIRCAYCHGAIEVFLNKKDKDGNVLPTPVKEPTGFAKFVKDNYKKHKRPDLKHADVMKLLSNEFAAINVNGKK